ncbi:MAG: flagellin [Candidatus Eremiobacteraeota bacterium]|nr:flagellin [Candidatus Eremiobacteraeota bacterium]
MELSNLTKFANSINLFQGLRQHALAEETAHLSSGLRINSAADDPSGLTIAESLNSRANGLEQGQRSLQDVNSALNVAEGALQTIADLLQRMRSLVVQANTDINSSDDLKNIQKELDQLRRQIDTISAKTQFNGRALLDGSLSSQIPKPAQPLFVVNPPLASASTGNNPPATPLLDPAQTFLNPVAQTVSVVMTVDSYDATTAPPTLNCTVVASSPDPTFGPAQTSQFAVDSGTNITDFGGGVTSPPPIGIADQNGNPVIDVWFNAIFPEDVGASSTIVSVPSQTKVSGQALQANVGRAEGDVVSVDLPATDATNLGVNQVDVTQSTMETTAAEYRLDYAIEALGGNRAQIGAQQIAVQHAGSNAAIDLINTTSSESAIRDADIGKEQAAFVRDQVLNSIDSSVLNQVNVAAKDVQTLLASIRTG